MTTDEYKQGFLHGYLEAEMSFGVYINLLEGKNVRYCVLKPNILLQMASNEQADKMRQRLGILKEVRDESKVRTDADKPRTIRAMRLQNFADIDRIVDILEGYTFIDTGRMMAWRRFLAAYKRIKGIGPTHKTWNPTLEAFMDDCMPIHRGVKGAYTLPEWKKRIKGHLDGTE